MSSRRCLRAASAIREVVSMAILREIKDPRVRNVTVTGVGVTPDLREAKVFVSVLGDETKAGLSIKGLQSAAGFLQAKIAERIETRYTPRLTFEVDQGAVNAGVVNRVLNELEIHRKGSESDEDEDGQEMRPAVEGAASFDPVTEFTDRGKRPGRALSRQSWSESLLTPAKSSEAPDPAGAAPPAPPVEQPPMESEKSASRSDLPWGASGHTSAKQDQENPAQAPLETPPGAEVPPAQIIAQAKTG